MTVQGFIDSLGGPKKVADALGLPFTTVASWGARGRVPKWRIPALAALAIENRKPLPASFGQSDKAAA